MENMEKGFWKNLKRPIIGLSPMDGVTDAPFRAITAKYGKPDLMLTEFTSAEGICAGATKMLPAFFYDEAERPVVAQLFGCEPGAFYKATFVVCELGFDGVDINMGCPSKSISSKGSGAALILTPAIAKEIVRKSRQACKDWAAGKTLEDAHLHPNIIEWVKTKRNSIASRAASSGKIRKELPVSVKTRIGYDQCVIEEWIKHLLEVEPVNISIHGRTLKQMYSGKADWEAVGRAAALIKQTETTVLGNGDVQNLTEAQEKITQYNLDGVLIGRAAFGNPWIFKNEEVTVEKKLEVAHEHSLLYEKIFSNGGSDQNPVHFMPMRKHLNWYAKGFPGAAEIRQKLMTCNNSNDVDKILKSARISAP